MILKFYEVKKIDTTKSKIILFYGKNDGQIKDSIDHLVKKHELLNYEQNEIIDKNRDFFDEIYTKSLFGESRVIIIKRVNDKILNTIQEIDTSKIEDSIIILVADMLDKRSKLRSTFEKDKSFICTAFYPDNKETLGKLASNFFRDNKISISQSSINTIIDKTNNDRSALLNELDKIKLYTASKKKLDDEKIIKLINLHENHSIAELVDSCLVKNKNKIVRILRDNNYNNEDCILITKIFLNKLKLIIKLSKEYENNNNLDLTISSAKPPIFWKDKEIVKQQIINWKTESLKKSLYEINELELLIKKNINNSINLLTDFIIRKASA